MLSITFRAVMSSGAGSVAGGNRGGSIRGLRPKHNWKRSCSYYGCTPDRRGCNPPRDLYAYQARSTNGEYFCMTWRNQNAPSCRVSSQRFVLLDYRLRGQVVGHLKTRGHL